MSADWIVNRRLIDGVSVREIRSVITANSITTEVCRSDWGIVDGEIAQVLFVSMRANAISAWHQHRSRWDYILVTGGHLRVVLVDPRETSSTRNQVDVFHLSPNRPQLLAVPPSIWHGVQNLGVEPASFVNLFNKPYNYEDPDEWRLPPDSSELPYVFR
jgi:dTDP-4-dehydrorhamnose 3,5-epimerase